MDFETKIVVKYRAAELFQEFLARPKWKPESIAFSGVTDCFQPAERQFKLTQSCLEVAWECRQPVSIVTKNALVIRDLELLREMASHRLVHVYVSVTTLDPALAREMEPRTSIPAARLRAIETLAAADVPVGVMVAPVIPGLNDTEIPQILAEAREAGAKVAAYVMLRLPLTVETVFQEWLERTQPDRASRVLQRIRETRNGKLNASDFHSRMTGAGTFAQQIKQLFEIFRRKYQYQSRLCEYDFAAFRPPRQQNGQLTLFDC